MSSLPEELQPFPQQFSRWAAKQGLGSCWLYLQSWSGRRAWIGAWAGFAPAAPLTVLHPAPDLPIQAEAPLAAPLLEALWQKVHPGLHLTIYPLNLSPHRAWLVWPQGPGNEACSGLSPDWNDQLSSWLSLVPPAQSSPFSPIPDAWPTITVRFSLIEAWESWLIRKRTQYHPSAFIPFWEGFLRVGGGTLSLEGATLVWTVPRPADLNADLYKQQMAEFLQLYCPLDLDSLRWDGL